MTKQVIIIERRIPKVKEETKVESKLKFKDEKEFFESIGLNFDEFEEAKPL